MPNNLLKFLEKAKKNLIQVKTQLKSTTSTFCESQMFFKPKQFIRQRSPKLAKRCATPFAFLWIKKKNHCRIKTIKKNTLESLINPSHKWIIRFFLLNDSQYFKCIPLKLHLSVPGWAMKLMWVTVLQHMWYKSQ